MTRRRRGETFLIGGFAIQCNNEIKCKSVEAGFREQFAGKLAEVAFEINERKMEAIFERNVQFARGCQGARVVSKAEDIITMENDKEKKGKRKTEAEETNSRMEFIYRISFLPFFLSLRKNWKIFRYSFFFFFFFRL